MRNLVGLVLLLSLLAGCLEAYREDEGYWGPQGYTVTMIQDNILKLTFNETAPLPSSDPGTDPTLWACAEEMLRRGYTHFVFLDQRSFVIQGFKGTPLDREERIYDAAEIKAKAAPPIPPKP
jgi:hypothetical protein